MEIRKVLFTVEKGPNAQPSFFVENPDDRNEGSLLRLPPGEVVGDAELVTVTAKVYRDPRVVDFVARFLRNAVTEDAWAERPADAEIDPGEEIAGIRFSGVRDIFRAPSVQERGCGAGWTGTCSASG